MRARTDRTSVGRGRRGSARAKPRAAGGKPAGERGQTAVEYALILAAFGLPMIILFRWLLGALAGYYGMVSFLETLPFP